MWITQLKRKVSFCFFDSQYMKIHPFAGERKFKEENNLDEYLFIVTMKNQITKEIF